MKYLGSRRKRISIHGFLILCAICTAFGLLMLTLRPVDPSTGINFPTNTSDDMFKLEEVPKVNLSFPNGHGPGIQFKRNHKSSSCATVEEMGEVFAGEYWKESLRVRKMIRDHFALHGASRVRVLPPEQFCRQGFVMGKASEAGFGNEMYKILTAAALSIMLNRSLIIGQSRHIGSLSSLSVLARFPFEDYISYTHLSFTLKEVKHLWNQNDCVLKYGRHLVMRTDDFEKPAETNVLCSNWMAWKQPIIWFQGTTDAVAAQFFLKNIHPKMRNVASDLFGQPEFLQSRPNAFGELMRVIVSPSGDVQEAVKWVLNGGVDPHIALHMRMLMNKPVRAVKAALNCIKKAMLSNTHQVSRPRVILVSDTPSLIKDITPNLQEFAEVLHFDYRLFKGNISSVNGVHQLDFRVKDWGPAPRWVAFVDFFLASRAKHAVVSGAHRRVGTTYAQLIAALAAANQLGENFSTGSSFSFFSSFQSNLLSEGLRNQVGWGHVWNRFAGLLSCHNQPNQCARTPLLPPAWWDGVWQSPIPRDIRRLETYGVQLTGFGTINENHLQSFCKSRKTVVKTVLISRRCSRSWDINQLSQVFSPKEVVQISRIQSSRSGAPDRRVWHFQSSGIYSVRSGYHRFRELYPSGLTALPSTSSASPTSCLKAVWVLELPPKVAWFIWRCMHNAIVVFKELLQKKVLFDSSCPICGGNSPLQDEACFKRWIPPTVGWVKVNVDGAAVNEGKFAGVGGIACDHHGHIFVGFVKSLCGGSPRVVEVAALRDGVSFAMAQGCRSAVFVFDSKSLVKAVLGGADAIHWEIQSTVLDIRVDLANLREFQILFCPRIANSYAHHLASFGLWLCRRDSFVSLDFDPKGCRRLLASREFCFP
ncbi:hypothetical protein HHK36_015892 [Tetracentron sinense]|uniref:RNase H type-1 domain-containing protein n=1 Tax=Tetracentron sinense TaxID=13715 RepID=A0A834Z326_TETSI|nr:hypothetical protein HHK36_015892 [Tetracentron sinense]